MKELSVQYEESKNIAVKTIKKENKNELQIVIDCFKKQLQDKDKSHIRAKISSIIFFSLSIIIFV